MREVDREVFIQEQIIFKHLTEKRSHFTLAASSRFEDTPGILCRWLQGTETVNVWFQMIENLTQISNTDTVNGLEKFGFRPRLW